MNFSAELNKPQLSVVTNTDGALLVLAGAGSGKTRTIIYRTAYLIKVKKENPYTILVVTFTNKAARELKDRLADLMDIDPRYLWIGTFHSICTRILRFEHEHIPYTSNFSIYDSDDQKMIFKKTYKELNIDKEKFPIAKIRSFISNQKDHLISPEEFFEFNDENLFTKTVHRIYKAYQKYLLNNNAMDFDDLIANTARLFHDKPKVRKKYEERFKYIMIDEYQDTNYAQFKLIHLLAREKQNICVVGDDDQAIYSWRGATIRNILEFEHDYQNVQKIRLEQNYRSPDIILNLANSLIKHNSGRHEKTLWSKMKSNDKPVLISVDNDYEEAEYVSEKLLELKQHTLLKNCAVLYRTNAQSRQFEQIFSKYGISYQIVGGVNFYQRKEIKDMIAYLRLLVNPQDTESLLRIINFPPRGIGTSTLQNLVQMAYSSKKTLFDAMLAKKDDPDKLGKRLYKIGNIYADLIDSADEMSLSALVEKVVESSGIIQYYEKSKDIRDETRLENIKEFVAAAYEFGEYYEHEAGETPTLSDFLQHLALQTDVDQLEDKSNTVFLMTMHNAKGLEFDYVFIVGLEDGLIPHARSIESEIDLEEERRLLYVAITRAKKNVFMSMAQTRRLYNVNTYTMPSRFIAELDKEFYRKEDYQSNNIYYNAKSKPKRIVKNSRSYFKIGQKIIHNKFGEGIVLNVEGEDMDAKLTISFPGGVLKKILGNYVTLKK